MDTTLWYFLLQIFANHLQFAYVSHKRMNNECGSVALVRVHFFFEIYVLVCVCYICIWMWTPCYCQKKMLK